MVDAKLANAKGRRKGKQAKEMEEEVAHSHSGDAQDWAGKGAEPVAVKSKLTITV